MQVEAQVVRAAAQRDGPQHRTAPLRATVARHAIVRVQASLAPFPLPPHFSATSTQPPGLPCTASFSPAPRIRGRQGPVTIHALVQNADRSTTTSGEKLLNNCNFTSGFAGDLVCLLHPAKQVKYVVVFRFEFETTRNIWVQELVAAPPAVGGPPAGAMLLAHLGMRDSPQARILLRSLLVNG